MERVLGMASMHPLLIFSKTSCCMCHVIKSLFIELRAEAAIYELDEDPNGREVEMVLIKLLNGRTPAVPVVFIGGQLVGPTDRVMTLHLSGALVPMLKHAGSIS